MNVNTVLEFKDMNLVLAHQVLMIVAFFCRNASIELNFMLAGYSKFSPDRHFDNFETFSSNFHLIYA